MSEDLKLSPTGLRLARFFMDEPMKRRSGSELTKATGITAGTLYPLLAKLETARWLTAEWEAIDPREEKRPRRRYYTLTALGSRNIRNALADYQLPAAMGDVAWSS